MKKENKLSQDKHENVTNINWLKVLAFGVMSEIQKVKNQTTETDNSTFIVLP